MPGSVTVGTYLMAIGAGFVAALLNFALVFEGSIVHFIVVGVVIYGITGSVFGFSWPSASWKWGLWISLPMWVFFLGLTLVGAGDASDQVLRTIPPIVAVIVGSLAAFFTSRIKSKKPASEA